MRTFTNMDKLSEIKTIKIHKNEYIQTLINNLFKKIKKNNIKIKDISKELSIAYITFWEYFNKKQAIPCHILLYLSKKFNMPLEYNKVIFETGPRRDLVCLPISLDKNLAFIIGAHLADGCLRKRSTVWDKNLNAEHYELVLREEYESNVRYFTETFNTIFKTKIKYKHNKNHYEFYISNKTIFYFLNLVLNIPSGKKSDIIKVPSYIFDSNESVKHSFLKGVFMFDGGINYVDGSFSLVSKSKDLIEGASILLNELNLPCDAIYLKPDKYLRYRLIIRKISKLKNLMSFFEDKTEKWYRIKEHLYGFDKPKDLNNDKNQENIQELIIKLDRFYHKKRKNLVSFSDFIKIIDQFNGINAEKASKILEIKERSAQNYLSKLEKLKLLKSEYINNKKFWNLQSNINIMRR